MAMAALGFETRFEKLKALGVRPFLLGLILFVLLLAVGGLASRLLMGLLDSLSLLYVPSGLFNVHLRPFLTLSRENVRVAIILRPSVYLRHSWQRESQVLVAE